MENQEQDINKYFVKRIPVKVPKIAKPVPKLEEKNYGFSKRFGMS